MKKRIGIISDNHHYNDLERQWDSNAAYAEDYEIKINNVEECDELIVLEYPKSALNCIVTGNCWVWSMEPPDEEWEWIRKCYKYFDKVITIDKSIKDPKFIQQQLAIPWQIEFGYDELIKMDPLSEKSKQLSFMTSSYDARKGHRKRLEFLKAIQPEIAFDLFGRGFREIVNKSEALLPYKYTIIVENSSYTDYWSEKLADAFLCGVLPFYYGCKNLEDYFDADSFIRIDISKPAQAVEIIKKAMQQNEWEKRKVALAKARMKILNEYQFFPVMAELINNQSEIKEGNGKEVSIPALDHHPSIIDHWSIHRIYYKIKRCFLNKKYNDPNNKLFGFVTYK